MLKNETPTGRLMQWSAMAALSLYLAVAGFVNGWKMQSDFPNYYVSARVLMEGKPVERIYDNHWFQEQINGYGIDQSGKFLPFPPPTAFVLLPLAPFDPLTAKRIWLVLNALLMLPLVRIISRCTQFSFLNSSLILLATGAGLANNFFLGQVYIPLLLSMFYGYQLAQRNKTFYAGFIWGLAASVKYLSLILLTPYLLKRDRKILPGFIVGFLLPHVIAFPWMGEEVYRQYLVIFYEHLNGEIEGQSPFAYQFQSWNALLRTLFVADAVNNPAPLLPSVFLFRFFRRAIEITVIVLALKMIYDARTHRRFIELTLAVIGISSFEILPESSSYTFILFSFPFVFLYRILEEESSSVALSVMTTLYAIIGCLPILLQEIVPPDSPLIFYRHWLMTLFYVLTIYWLWPVTRRVRAACKKGET
jgi:hypothetical protein